MAFAMHLLLLVTLNGKPRPLYYSLPPPENQIKRSESLKSSRFSTPGTFQVQRLDSKPSNATLLKARLQVNA